MIAQLDPQAVIILERFQHDFPIVARPFDRVGEIAGIEARRVIELCGGLLRDGVISRIGAVVAPNAVTVSTLAAMSVPPSQIDSVVAAVNAEPGVNHNYEREHAVNIWFVISAASEADLTDALARVAENTGFSVMDLRLERPFHLDLGFSLAGQGPRRRPSVHPDLAAVGPEDHRLLAAIEDGIALVERPFAVTGEQLGWSEGRVIERLRRLSLAHVIRRFGVVVRHHSIGLRANAMAVWDVPDDRVDQLGATLAAEPGVTLCYRRRRAPDWQFNLYCMVHGVHREQTRQTVARLDALVGRAATRHGVLFSKRCFRQTGARFRDARRAA